MTFKFKTLPFVNGLISDLMYLASYQIPSLNPITIKRDVRDFLAQEKDCIIAKYINNKKVKYNGKECFVVDAKCLPGGWIFKRFVAGFIEKQAPNAFRGIPYSWKPIISDPKIELSPANYLLSCDNLPEWLEIDDETNTIYGSPNLSESAFHYELSLKASYNRFGQEIQVVASIPLSLYHYTNLNL